MCSAKATSINGSTYLRFYFTSEECLFCSSWSVFAKLCVQIYSARTLNLLIQPQLNLVRFPEHDLTFHWNVVHESVVGSNKLCPWSLTICLKMFLQNMLTQNSRGNLSGDESLAVPASIFFRKPFLKVNLSATTISSVVFDNSSLIALQNYFIRSTISSVLMVGNFFSCYNYHIPSDTLDNQDHLPGDNSNNGQSITLPFTFYLL